MRPTDFSKSLTNFLSCYLPGEKGISKNTIASYRDTFVLFLTFMKDEKGIPADKLTLKQLDKEKVMDFLDWIEEKRLCSAATRNVRLAALHSFFRYLQYQSPESLLEWHRILSLPVKKTEKASISYLSLEGIRLLLEEPDRSTRNGRRDLALLSLMYDSGSRVTGPGSHRLDTLYGTA